MKRNMIVKNAKFNSKTSDKIIRIKEVDDQFAIIENVKHVDGRYKAIADSQRVIEIASIQKSYEAGSASKALARLKTGVVCEARRTNGSFIQVVSLTGNQATIQNGYYSQGTFKLIDGSQRRVTINSLMASYKLIK